MNRGGGGLGTVILAAIGFAVGMGIMRYAYGDLFNPGIWVGMGIGWAVGLVLVYFLRRRP